MATSNEVVRRSLDEVPEEEPSLPMLEKPEESTKGAVHPAVFVISWMCLSSVLILFNKQILDYAHFHFPIFLTTWHLAFATLMTQILARWTKLLDGRKTLKMTGRLYLRAIVPIGIFFSLSLICGNVVYLYLSVAFIQMLKATTPVVVLLTTWAFGVAPVNYRELANVSVIVAGVIVACFGQMEIVWLGVLLQLSSIVFESIRLVMVQRLLTSADFSMDPLVSLYYFAPVCALMNGVISLIVEVPHMAVQDFLNVGIFTLLANAVVAFLLNVSVVFLISRTSSLVMRLCGILKDILIVVVSMLLWHTPINQLQIFGYTISLCGLVYYCVGGEKLREYAFQAARAVAGYNSKNSSRWRIAIIAGSFLVLMMVMGGVAVSYSPESVERVKALLSGGPAGGDAA